MIFLQILGGIFLLILLVIGYFVFRFWRGIRRALEASSGDFAKVIEILPPIFLELDSLPDSEWRSKDAIKQDKKLLTAAGFHHEGDYKTFHGLSEMHLSVWKHPKNQIAVIIIEGFVPDDDSVPVAYLHDVCLKGQVGAFTLTNSTQGALLPRPKKYPYVIQEDKSLRDLLSSLKQHIPSNFKPVPFAKATDLYKVGAQEYAIWLYQREQLVSEKIERLFEPLQLKLEGELLDQLVEYGQEEASRFHSENIVKFISERTKMSAGQWEQIRDRLVVVHAKMSGQNVCDALYQLVNYEQLDSIESDIEAASESKEAVDPFKLLDELTKKADAVLPKCIATLSKPMPAKIFIGIED